MTRSLFSSSKRDRVTRALFVATFVGGLGVLGRFLPVGQWLSTLTDTLRGAGAVGVLLFVLAYTPGALLFVPSAMFSFAAGFAFGPIWAPFIAIPGIALSSLTVFSLTRSVLRKTVEQWLGDDPRFRILDPLLTQYGPRAVVLLRFSPLSPFSVLNFAFGLTGMKGSQYLVASAIGCIPGTVFYSQLGALAPRLDDIASGRLPEGGRTQTYFIVAGIVLTVAVAIWLSRLAKRALAELDGKPAELEP